jgi:hypothetical protein
MNAAGAKGWDGVERRKECVITDGEFCKTHIEMVSNIVKMQTTLETIAAYMKDNKGIFKSNMGILAVVIVHIITVAFFMGGMSKQLNINTKKWENHDTEVDKVVKEMSRYSYGYNDFKAGKYNANN